MEVNHIGKTATVVPVILRSIVQRSAIRSQRCGHHYSALWKFRASRARQFDRAKQRCIGSLSGQTILRVAHSRYLIAGGQNALRSGLDVSTMHGNDFLRRVLQNVCRPKRSIDLGPKILKFRGHATVHNVDSLQNRIPLFCTHRLCPEWSFWRLSIARSSVCCCLQKAKRIWCAPPPGRL